MRGDLDNEVRFHLEMRIAECRARGMSEAEAEAEANRRFGDVGDLRKNALRAGDRQARMVRVAEWIDAWRRDASSAARRLRDTPMFTIAATLTLAIATAATASVFGVVDSVLLKAFPYRDPQRVLAIWESSPERQFAQFPAAVANYLDWRAQNHTFSAFAATDDREVTITGKQDPERVVGLSVTPSYFSALGVAPVLGRALAADSDGPAEVVVGYSYWQRRFGSAPTALGQTLTLDDSTYTVVGVMPPGLPGAVEMWIRLSFTGPQTTNRESHHLSVYGRLKPGVTPEGARSDLETVARRLASTYPASNENWTVLTVPLVDQLVGQVRPALIMVLSAAGCVLLIGAANLANLFLVRCLARQRELAVRTALGATRSRLVRELVVEAAVLGLIAGALGVGGSVAGVRVLRSLAPLALPRVSQVGVDARVVGFCALTSIAAVLVFGLLPAWQASRNTLADVLKEGGRGTGSAQSRGLQDALVVLQVAVALVLLTGAGLLVESFGRFERMDPGFRPEGVLTAQVVLPNQRYPTPQRQTAFVLAVIDRLAGQPGVDAATAGDALPGTGANINVFAIIGNPSPDPIHVPTAYAIGIGADYFRTLGMHLLRGRGVLRTDDSHAPKVAVIDELLAQRFFAGRDPIGQRFTFSATPAGPDTIEIVGVVATVKEGGLAAAAVPEIYAPMAQYQEPWAAIAVHTRGDPEALAGVVRQAVASVDPTIPVFDIRTMNERMAQSIGTTRFSTFLASLFAVIALVLSMIGIYSVLTYIVSQRQREIGVRIALGASRTQVIGGVVRRALALTGTGIAVGSVAAWGLTRVLAGLFLGVSPHDPGIFVGSAIAFTGVALVAAALPAFRTTRVNPVAALTST